MKECSKALQVNIVKFMKNNGSLKSILEHGIDAGEFEGSRYMKIASVRPTSGKSWAGIKDKCLHAMNWR